MTKKYKILWLASTIYALLLAGMTLATILNFTQRNFALLFALITVWPIGRFFLLRHPLISDWLNRQDR